MSIWTSIVAAFGTIGMVVAGVFAARATTRAATATAEATKAAASAQAEPEQRRADLEAFKAIREELAEQTRELRTETTRLRGIVRAFAGYVGELTMQMRSAGVEPPPEPELVSEYNRTGV